MKKTYVDSGVLIAATQGKIEILKKATHIIVKFYIGTKLKNESFNFRIR